jgi:hypothetical protein
LAASIVLLSNDFIIINAIKESKWAVTPNFSEMRIRHDIPPPTQSRINERASLQYWAFRVDRRYLTDLGGELQHGRLRQGWGWDNGQDLRDMKIDSGAGRNRRMFLEVKKWDRILIPHLPQYGQITYRRGDRRLGSGLQLLNLAEVRRPRPHIPGENPTQFPPHQFEYSRLD